jgi:RNA polymerase sigma factor (sigma-70 family)
MSFDSDAEIVQTVLSGDKQAYGELINRYWGMVYQLAWQHLAEPMLAEDRAQEAFLQAFLSLEHLQQPAQFRAWIYGITLNLCKNFLRKQQPLDFFADFEDDWQEAIASPDTLAEFIELRSVLQESVSQLSQANQEALNLYYYEGFSLAEIASILRISSTAVKGRLHKSRQALKRQLAQLFPSQTLVKGLKKMIPVQIVDISQQVKSNNLGANYPLSQLLLFNEESRRALVVFWIEADQALAIAQILAGYTPQRPRQHDFAAKLIEATGASLEFVLLDHIAGEIPYATLNLKTKAGKTSIDARPGDAVVLALSLKAQVFVSEKMWEKASPPLPAGQNPNRKGIQAAINQLEDMRAMREAWASQKDGAEARHEVNQAIRKQAREIIDAAFS